MSTLCPNCGHTYDGEYCPACGQRNRDYRRSLPPMMGELVQEAFEIDGRILRSLKLLLFQPGALSRAFSANQRAAYISPIRLYLFTSILFFFAFAQSVDIDRNVIQPDISTDTEVDETRVARFKQLIGPDQATAVDRILAQEGSLSRAILINMMDDDNADTSPFVVRQVVSTLDDPRRALDNLIENAPIAAFVLLPVYALMLKIIYFGTRRYYVEHMVFALHLHAFAFLMFSALMLIPDSWDAAAFSLFLLYYFLALKRYYGESVWRTGFKYLVLLTGYSILLLPAVLAVMAVTVSTL